MRWVLLLLLVGCREGAPPTVVTETAPSISAVPSSPPTEIASSPPPVPPSTGGSCLMAHVCGCNLGCTRVSIAAADLRDGSQTVARSGPLKGTTVHILKDTDTQGASVFTVSDRDRNSFCLTAAERTNNAYLCSNVASGPVPSNACGSGCD